MDITDKNTFREVFKKYYNPLCNFATSIVHDRKLAQDVVQDVFTNLWSKREEVAHVTNDKSYLFSAVKNRALELIRKSKKEEEVSQIHVDNKKANTQNNIEEEAKKFLMKEKLFNSIRQLPPKCQEVFVLNKINGLTYQEVADELNISVKTVENQIGKGYRKLRELMAGELSDL